MTLSFSIEKINELSYNLYIQINIGGYTNGINVQNCLL